MSVPLTINGVTFNYPVEGDTHWGPTLTAWSTAVTNALKPLAGGFLTLSPFPSSGVVFANATNTGFLALTVNGSNQLTFNGTPIGASSSLADNNFYIGNGSNVPTPHLLSGDVTTTDTGVVTIANLAVTGAKIANLTITNAQVSATAAIAFTKLATTTANAFITSNAGGVLTPVLVTANSAVATDSNGLPVASTTTATELSFVHGVTSSIQSQVNSLAGGLPGTIIDYAGTTVPLGYLNCDGSAVSRTTYNGLFTAIGVLWGPGDGSTTFNLPNLSRRVTVGNGGAGTAVLGNAVGNVGGEETHTLTVPEIPSHNHGATSVVTDPGHSHVETAARAGGGTPVSVASFNYSTTPPAFITLSNSTASATTGITVATSTSGTGGDGAHNNMQPSAVVMKLIKT